jgi:hypothetical protein
MRRTWILNHYSYKIYLGGLSSTLENRKLSRRLEKKRKFSIRSLPGGTVFHTGKPEVEQKI